MRFSLVPRDTKFTDLLASAADTAAQAAVLFQQMLAGYPQTIGMFEQIHQLEHQGDRILRNMVAELRGTFVTPLDREDLYELAKILDDVIDYIDETASLFDTYQVEATTECVRRQADVLVKTTIELASAMRSVEDPAGMEMHWAAIHSLESEGDAVYRQGIKEVFAACYDEPAIIICWKDIYQQMEKAIDSCEEAAAVLEGVHVKNS